MGLGPLLSQSASATESFTFQQNSTIRWHAARAQLDIPVAENIPELARFGIVTPSLIVLNF